MWEPQSCGAPTWVPMSAEELLPVPHSLCCSLSRGEAGETPWGLGDGRGDSSAPEWGQEVRAPFPGLSASLPGGPAGLCVSAGCWSASAAVPSECVDALKKEHSANRSIGLGPSEVCLGRSCCAASQRGNTSCEEL